jgi:hypothetical protein
MLKSGWVISIITRLASIETGSFFYPLQFYLQPAYLFVQIGRLKVHWLTWFG